MSNILLGACSWNYDSWINLVYSQKQRSAAAYLQEYAKKYQTAEIDSWFYKIPDQAEVKNYLQQVDKGFKFTCKVSETITLTHKRNFQNPSLLIPNEQFLSTELFNAYLKSIDEMLPALAAVMFEFEYLKKEKMTSVDRFIELFGFFYDKIKGKCPLAVEIRNQNYLTENYFKFLDDGQIMHVFSEKQHMPHVYDIYEKYHHLFNQNVVIRLLGGDRKEMEKKTNQQWHEIVEEKHDKERVVDMALDIVKRGKDVIINVNNHYEGSAPKTIESFRRLFNDRGVIV
jgi:uncharacterized protein YecE (DUF72 family)